MLVFEQVSKQFGPQVAVSGLSLRLAPGEFVGLIGANGAGKSTALKMAAGHLRPSQGQIRVNGLEVGEHPLELRHNVGYVPEYVALYEYLTGREYLDFVGEIKGLPEGERRRALDDLLEVLDLGEERDRLIRTYSQGMRRKVALAGALLGRPRLLLLDEALNGLDPTTNHRLKAYLKGLTREGTTILLSSHLLEVLERICSRVAVMRAGRLIEDWDEAGLEAIRQAEGGLEHHFVTLMGAPDGPKEGR